MNKNKASRFTKAILAVMLAFTLTACSTGSKTENDPSGASQTNPETPVKLRITWAGSQVRHDATLKALNLYTEKNPNVTFEPEYMGWDTYYTKLAIQSASKTLPDIVQIDTANIKEYASRNQFADLTGAINESDIDKNLIDAGKMEGKQFGFPLGSNAVSFLYNKPALEKLGVTVPENGWTWDQLLATARSIQPKLEKGKYVLEDLSVAIGADEMDKYEIYQLSQGKGYSHTPEGAFNIDKDTFLEFNQLFAQLRQEGIVPPVDVTLSHKEYDPKQDNLLNGTVLILRNFAAAYGAFDAVKPGEIAVTTVPRGKQTGEFLIPTQFFAVSANSPQSEAAKKFIDWFVNDPEAGNVLLLNRGKQVSNKVSEAVLPKLTDTEKTQIEMIDKAAKDANPFWVRPQGFGAWTDEYFPKVSQEIAFGRITAEQGYEELKKKFAEYVK